ncbi:MAG: hypothetical protein AAFU61_13280 [Pseudomonadota bacterium]
MPVSALPAGNPLARLADLFGRILRRVGELTLTVLRRTGAWVGKLDEAAERAIVAPLMGFAEALWDGIVDGLGAAQDAAEAGAAFVAAGLETLMETADGFLDALFAGIEDLAQDGLETGYEMALSLFEAMKKTVHLVLDQLALGKLGEAAAGAAQIPLDLIDNLLGNAAEMASPKLGARARVLREDMYGQLKSAREAAAARGVAGAPDGEKPAPRRGRADKPKSKPKPSRGGR